MKAQSDQGPQDYFLYNTLWIPNQESGSVLMLVCFLQDEQPAEVVPLQHTRLVLKLLDLQNLT